MADTNVATFDKVGVPGPDASHHPVGDGQPFLAVCPPAPAHMIERDQANSTEKPADKTVDKPEPALNDKKSNGITAGPTHSLGAPKPVEVTSVPQTPLNNSTPAGGTPRPELKIADEPMTDAPEPPKEPPVLTEIQESKPAPVTSAPQETHKTSELAEAPKPAKEPKPSAAEPLPLTEPVTSKAPEPAPKESLINGSASVDKAETKPEAPVTHTGPQSDSVPAPAPAPAAAPVAPPAPISESSSSRGPESLSNNDSAKPLQENGSIIGEKRKLDEAVSPAVAKPLNEDQPAPTTAPLEKKPKIDDVPTESNEQEPIAAAAEPPSSSPKNSKPKKEKKLPPVGRTARKTRSQGPVDL